ncbi:MAG: dienelactone hydrolase family protein [Pseudomonadota bacterium]
MSVRASPHTGQPVRSGGPSLSTARLVVVLAHGRGGSPEDMLNLGGHLGIVDVAYVAPAAAGRSWWPQSFLVPLEENEPWLDSALSAFNDTVDAVIRQGVLAERIVVAGFSQGACLALEHAARAARDYFAIIGLSGGLLGTRNAGGPPTNELYGNARKGFDYSGRVDGVTVFLGCHQHDPHIPLKRVCETENVFRAMGGDVTTQIYPGWGHGIVEQEVSFLRGLLNG